MDQQEPQSTTMLQTLTDEQGEQMLEFFGSFSGEQLREIAGWAGTEAIYRDLQNELPDDAESNEKFINKCASLRREIDAFIIIASSGLKEK